MHSAMPSSATMLINSGPPWCRLTWLLDPGTKSPPHHQQPPWWLIVGSIDTFQPDNHYDVIKWKHLPRYWPFGRGIPRSPVNSPHKSQWCGALIFSLICTWINGLVNREAGDLRRHRTHDVIVMIQIKSSWKLQVHWGPSKYKDAVLPV